MDDALFMTVPEVAQLMRCSENTIRNLIHAGEIKAVRVGGFRIRRDWFAQYLEREARRRK